ncbi:MAG: hypothetical protein AAF639_06565 [Chloroflexota bacterium]
MRYVFSIILLVCMMTGCVISPPEDSAVEIPAVEQTETTDNEREITITELTFDGNGDTFLTAISQQRAGLSGIIHYRYISLPSTGPVYWQGEQFQTDEETITLLQAVGGNHRSGGTTAWRLTSVQPPSEDVLLKTLSSAVDEEAELATGDLPDAAILFVRATQKGNNQWTFNVTLDHPDTGWADYTDGWHVETATGEILGTRILLHPHVNEMPFTRSHTITIPPDITEVYVRSHDLVSGYGLDTVAIPLTEAVTTEQVEVQP